MTLQYLLRCPLDDVFFLSLQAVLAIAENKTSLEKAVELFKRLRVFRASVNRFILMISNNDRDGALSSFSEALDYRMEKGRMTRFHRDLAYGAAKRIVTIRTNVAKKYLKKNPIWSYPVLSSFVMSAVNLVTGESLTNPLDERRFEEPTNCRDLAPPITVYHEKARAPHGSGRLLPVAMTVLQSAKASRIQRLPSRGHDPSDAGINKCPSRGMDIPDALLDGHCDRILSHKRKIDHAAGSNESTNTVAHSLHRSQSTDCANEKGGQKKRKGERFHLSHETSH